MSTIEVSSPGLQSFAEHKAAVVKLAKQASSIVVQSADARDKAVALAKDIRGVLSKVEDVRVELKEPYLKAGKLIDEAAKTITADLKQADEAVRKQILAWDKEQERIEAERKRKEAEERALRDKAVQKFSEIHSTTLRAIAAATSWEKVNALFDDFAADCVKAKESGLISESLIQSLLVSADEMRTKRREQIEAEALLSKKEAAASRREAKQEAAVLAEDASATVQAHAEIDAIEARAADVAAEVPKALRSKWSWEVTDITKVPAEYLKVNEALLTAAVRGGKREIKGVRIYEEKILHIR